MLSAITPPGRATPPRARRPLWRRVGATLAPVSDALDVDAMINRFRERAKAVKNRPLPPVEGPERRKFLERAQVDFMDYAMIGDAEASFEDGVLTLRIDLRPG